MLRRRMRAPASSSTSIALSGQAAAGDVPIGQLDGRRQRLVENLHAMVRFISVAQALENLDRVGLAGRIDGDRLEPPGQGGVLLDVFAIFVERGGADALNLAARQGRLEHVAGVDGAFGPAGADQRVQFVDEENHVLGPADFVHHRLDALFKLAAVFRAGHHHRQIEHDDPAIVQDLRHGAGDHHLGQAFDDGGLADAGLAQKDRVVLLPPAEDLDDALDLVLSADDRIKLPFAWPIRSDRGRSYPGPGSCSCLRGPVFPVAGVLRFPHLLPEDLRTSSRTSSSFKPRFINTCAATPSCSRSKPQQQMFRADIIVIEVPGLFDGVFNDFLGPGRLRQPAHGDHVRAALDELFDLEPNLAKIDVEILQYIGPDAAPFLDQPEQYMLGADVFVVEAWASWFARAMTLRARSVNRSNMSISSRPGLYRRRPLAKGTAEAAIHRVAPSFPKL